MQEWINAVFTSDWLLGFSMGIATKAILKGLRNVRGEFSQGGEDRGRRKPPAP